MLLDNVFSQKDTITKTEVLGKLQQKKWFTKLKFTEFIKDTDGNISGTRVFALILLLATIGDWMMAVFTVGVWHPNWEQVGTLLGLLGFKFSQKVNAKVNVEVEKK